MDFYAEAEKRKQKRLDKLSTLIGRRFTATRAIEDNQKLIDEIDIGIAELEAALFEIDQSQRNFNTYLAVREGAMTTDDLADAIRAGGSDVEGTTGATDGGDITPVE